MSPDIFRWGRGLPHEGVGAKKFGMPLETREIKLFWRDIPGFCRDIPGVGFGKRGLFRKAHFLEFLENLELLEILENPGLWKIKDNPTIF